MAAKELIATLPLPLGYLVAGYSSLPWQSVVH